MIVIDPQINGGSPTVMRGAAYRRHVAARVARETPTAQSRLERLREAAEYAIEEETLKLTYIDRLLNPLSQASPRWQAFEALVSRHAIGSRSEQITVEPRLVAELLKLDGSGPNGEWLSEAELRRTGLPGIEGVIRTVPLEVAGHECEVRSTAWMLEYHEGVRQSIDLFEVSDMITIRRQSKKHGSGGRYYVAPEGFTPDEAQAYDVLRRDGLTREVAAVAARSTSD